MTLIKTSLLNGIAVLIKMLTLLGLNKILAIYVGPAGFAALGQFQNAVQMITTLASSAINTGVTKYTAEFYDDEESQHTVWRTAGTVSLVGSVVVAVGVILFSKPLAVWFLKDEGLSGVFVWFALTLVLFVFNALLLAILNGKKEIERYVAANIAGSLFSLAVTAVMAVSMGLYGALVALAVYQSLAFFVTFALTSRATWFKLQYLFGVIDTDTAKNLAKYTAMALTSAACVPLSHIFIRNHLGTTLSWEEAGYWEAMWRLSNSYLLLVTTTLAVYYLPKLSELKTKTALRLEIIQGYKLILPVSVASGATIYILKDWLVALLFTDQFSGMTVLFGWQMIGDTLKIASWIISYLMLSKGMTTLYITSEIFFTVLFYAAVVFFTSLYQLEGASIAHALNYIVYFLVMLFLVGKKYLARS